MLTKFSSLLYPSRVDLFIFTWKLGYWSYDGNGFSCVLAPHICHIKNYIAMINQSSSPIASTF